MARSKSTKKTVVSVPQSIEELAEFVQKIGERQRALTRIEAICNRRIERAKKHAMENSAPHEEAKSQLFEGIFIYCQSHRDELTEGGKTKTVHLPTGDISWRLTPPAVSIRDGEKIITQIESLGLEHFIRVKKGIDKEAMLKEPDVAKQIKGVTIDQREEFAVRPSQVEIEISRDTKKLQKLLPQRLSSKK